ncbi:MgtC/SapB family protein [Anaerotignum faecicola]|nr:MgtC/SapB family protein [Anaerotignum faecicola]
MKELNEFVFYLRQLNMASLLLRFVFAIICGGIVGFDRGKKHRPAGLRTHLLVCIGAASVMIVNQYISVYLSPGSDMSRMGAQVISGVGFLSAGTIIVSGHRHVKGLTTAAGLWASACMGLVIGIGYYECAVIMCAAIIAVLHTANKLDHKYIKSTQMGAFYIEHDGRFKMSDIIKIVKEYGYAVSGIEYITNGRSDFGAVQMTVEGEFGGGGEYSLISRMQAVEGVLFIEVF